ncbi:MAG TPA: X2-like carbohydrate binding domain-containing protein, partial [Clostridia bacterium]
NQVFDLSDPQDITVTVTGNPLSVVKNGPTDLTNWDYSVSGSTVTIKKSYLTYFFSKFNKPDQKLKLTFEFELANSGVLTITRK